MIKTIEKNFYKLFEPIFINLFQNFTIYCYDGKLILKNILKNWPLFFNIIPLHLFDCKLAAWVLFSKSDFDYSFEYLFREYFINNNNNNDNFIDNNEENNFIINNKNNENNLIDIKFDFDFNNLNNNLNNNKNNLNNNNNNFNNNINNLNEIYLNFMLVNFLKFLFYNLQLTNNIIKKMEKSEFNYLIEKESPLIFLLSKMELTGIKTNFNQIKKLIKDIKNYLFLLQKEVNKFAEEEINISSPKQVSNLLFNKLNLKIPSNNNYNNNKNNFNNDNNNINNKNKYQSTSDLVLSSISHLHPLPKIILEYRSISKLLNTYIHPLILLNNKNNNNNNNEINLNNNNKNKNNEINLNNNNNNNNNDNDNNYNEEGEDDDNNNNNNGKIFCNWNQTNSANGRISSTSPNLQNLPRSPILLHFNFIDNLNNSFNNLKNNTNNNNNNNLNNINDNNINLNNNNINIINKININNNNDNNNNNNNNNNINENSLENNNNKTIKIDIRSAFEAEKGNCFVAFDYSQLEARILAHYCLDNDLVYFFRSGQDIHSLIAAKCFNTSVDEVSSFEREKAKTICYGY